MEVGSAAVGTLQDALQSEEALLLPQPQALNSAPPLPRRTKLVFLYSSDDEDDGDGEVLRNGKAAVEEAAVLNPPPEELHAMRREAEEAEKTNSGAALDEMPLFMEDTAGEAGALEPLVPRSRVKVVDALPLRDGGGAGNNGAPLRRHLSVEEAERLSHARKRFREEEERDVDDDVATDSERVVCEPRPVVDDEGLVRAVEVGGYQLTVDEGELQDSGEEGGEREGEPGQRGDEDDGYVLDDDDNGDDEDEEDEEDEELDAALVVAVVEQLIRCCESDELDEALRDDSRSFLERAKPCLEQLNAGELDPFAFGEAMRSDILRLQRAFRRSCRPKDAPIVIDGVVMDM
ncbi:hypothetical protein DQ04_04161000 [Trypanosoma grayi]|uniref:hypothetical protein n=1 Tax=Trypanosoma grayi TaxID=71804 RepID=UPI0004F4B979|nr:hypothetical protein DQ04_04161000 [Trypanosoma grayi]KEG10102.1 hypothetical protein DQ04_04161000 [Trypanosoma grayi]